MPLTQFRNFIDNLANIDFGAKQTQIINSNQDELVRLQTLQWEQGKDENGDPILLEGNGYNPFYADLKRKYGEGIGRITDHVTLFLTGALYKATFVSITSGNYTFSSRVPYFGELMTRTGDVTGLNAESRKSFALNFVLKGVEIEVGKLGLRVVTKQVA